MQGNKSYRADFSGATGPTLFSWTARVLHSAAPSAAGNDIARSETPLLVQATKPMGGKLNGSVAAVLAVENTGGPVVQSSTCKPVASSATRLRPRAPTRRHFAWQGFYNP